MTAAATQQSAWAGLLACPACRGELGSGADHALVCGSCARRYDIVAGIPDLRLEYPDPYVSWEEDLSAARELESAFEQHDFAGLLRRHWRQSGKPAELVERFVARELADDTRSATYVQAIEAWRGKRLEPGDRFLEVGCGAAGLAAAAAERAGQVVASDLSMRWMVLAKKRLVERGVSGVRLVCCGAEDPPFREGSFDVVAAADVVEHVSSQSHFTEGCSRMLRPGGVVFLATPNRFSLGLEPHVRLWGVGLLPRSFARRYVQIVRKAPYDHVRLLSAGSLRRLLVRNGFADVEVVPPAVTADADQLYGSAERRLVHAYNTARRFRPARRLLLAIGPFFHVFGRKPSL